MDNQNSKEPISKLSAWTLAVRPKTLPAAVAPVLVGSAAAMADGHFVWLPAAAALAVAVMMQIAVNLANDYFDYIKGIDTAERQGPIRVTHSGLIPPGQVRNAMLSTMVLAAIPGIYLALRGGFPVILIGSACVVAALIYSGGPLPLASNAMGDVCVFIFFGLVAVGGTYYVQALELHANVIKLGIIMGLLITAILVVNNLRDIQSDAKTGKRTLAVVLGARGSKLEYLLLIAGAYALPVFLWLGGSASAWLLLPLLSMPFASMLVYALWHHHDGTSYNRYLAMTANLALLYSFLLSAGLVIAK